MADRPERGAVEEVAVRLRELSRRPLVALGDAFAARELRALADQLDSVSRLEEELQEARRELQRLRDGEFEERAEGAAWELPRLREQLEETRREYERLKLIETLARGVLRTRGAQPGSYERERHVVALDALESALSSGKADCGPCETCGGSRVVLRGAPDPDCDPRHPCPDCSAPASSERKDG